MARTDTALSPAPSKSSRAYDHIAHRIADGRYTPGYRLVLGQIAGELGVSVVPVRDAIRRLEAEGLVTFKHNVGAQVAMVHEADYVATMETLSIIEGAATALATPYVQAPDIARARGVNRRMAESLTDLDPARFTELNLEFHSVLFERCPNEHLLELVHRGWSRLRMLRQSTFSFVPDRAQGSVDEHEQILRLIEQDAPAMVVELAARQHRMATVNAYLAHDA